MNLVATLNRQLREHYARKKPAKGQKSIFSEEDHPRDADGQFASKEEKKPATLADFKRPEGTVSALDETVKKQVASIPGQMGLFGKEDGKPALVKKLNQMISSQMDKGKQGQLFANSSDDLPGQKLMFGEEELNATRKKSLFSRERYEAGWKKVGGSSVYVDESGEIEKGCPGLKGEMVNDLIDESDESRERREHRQDVAKAQGIEGHEITKQQAKKLGSEKSVAAHREIKSAAAKFNANRHSLIQAIDDAFKLKKVEAVRKEQVKRASRDLTGLDARDMSRMENGHLDYSTVPNFDTHARTLAYRFPDELGHPDSGENHSERLWDLLREGKGSVPSKWSSEVIETAAQMAEGTAMRKDRKQEEDDSFDFGFADPDRFSRSLDRYIKERYSKTHEERLAEARENVNQNPSEKQRESGNYKKGHFSWNGLSIAIENPKGSERSGKSKSGHEWSVTMENDYGYFKATDGKDGDHVDVFIGPNLDSEIVFVVNQNVGGKFDEHKVVIGAVSESQAKEVYLSNYSEGWTGFDSIASMTLRDFKKWVKDTRKTHAKAKYSKARYSAGKDGNALVSYLIEQVETGKLSPEEAAEQFRSAIEDGMDDEPEQYAAGSEGQWTGPHTGPRGGTYFQKGDRKVYRKTAPGTGKKLWNAARTATGARTKQGLEVTKGAAKLYADAIAGRIDVDSAVEQFKAMAAKVAGVRAKDAEKKAADKEAIDVNIAKRKEKSELAKRLDAEISKTSKEPNLASYNPEQDYKEKQEALRGKLKQIDADFESEVKRMSSEKGRLQRSKSKSAKKAVQQLEQDYDELKSKKSRSIQEIGAQLRELQKSYSPSEKPRSQEPIDTKNARRSDDWETVKANGGAEAVLSDLDSQIKKQTGIDARTGEKNKWKSESRLKSLKQQRDYVASLASEFGEDPNIPDLARRARETSLGEVLEKEGITDTDLIRKIDREIGDQNTSKSLESTSKLNAVAESIKKARKSGRNIWDVMKEDGVNTRDLEIRREVNKILDQENAADAQRRNAPPSPARQRAMDRQRERQAAEDASKPPKSELAQKLDEGLTPKLNDIESHLKSIGASEDQIGKFNEMIKDKDGVVIVNRGKVEFVDSFSLLNGNRSPESMLDELKGRRGKKFTVHNATAKRDKALSDYASRVANSGEWDSGNLTSEQQGILESLVSSGKLIKRKGNESEMTANGIPTIYEPVSSASESTPKLKTGLKTLPGGVQTHIEYNVNKLKRLADAIKQGREADKKFQGEGRYTEDAVRNANVDVDAVHKDLDEFRKLAKQNGYDAEAVLKEAGLPDVSEYQPKSGLTKSKPEDPNFTGVAANGVRYVNGVPQKGPEEQKKPRAPQTPEEKAKVNSILSQMNATFDKMGATLEGTKPKGIQKPDTPEKQAAVDAILSKRGK